MEQLGPASAQQQKDFMRILKEIEMKSAQQRLLDGGDTCFDICINSFNDRQINNNEINCIKACADKFFHVQTRCMIRWAESMQNQQERTLEYHNNDIKFNDKISELESKLNDK